MKKTIAFAFWFKGTFEIEDTSSTAEIDLHIREFSDESFRHNLKRKDNLKVTGYGVEVGPGADYGAPQADVQQAGFKQT